MARRFLTGLALSAFLLTPVGAETPTTTLIGTPPQPAWKELSADQRTALSPLAGEWDKMENYRRKKWLGIADRYARMNPEGQRRVQDRMREWATMTPEQRARIRDGYKEFKQLPPAKKQAVKRKWETYSRLADDEKARIKQGKAAARVAAPAETGPAQAGTSGIIQEAQTTPPPSTSPAIPPTMPNPPIPATDTPKP